MNILLAGGSGSIGIRLIDELNKNNKLFVTYRKKKIKTKANIKLLHYNKLNQIKNKIDVIINCVVTHKNSSKNASKDYLDSNVNYLIKLIDFYKKKDSKIFINLSTISVYEKNIQGLIDEKKKKNTTELLSLTKLISEQIVSSSDINFINMRLPSVINFGNNDYNWINKTFLKLKINEKIFIKNPKNKINEIIDVKSIADFIKKIMRIKKFDYRETINFLPNKTISIEKIINIIKKKLKSKSKIDFEIKNYKYKIYSSKKLEKIFNFKVENIEKTLLRNL